MNTIRTTYFLLLFGFFGMRSVPVLAQPWFTLPQEDGSVLSIPEMMEAANVPGLSLYIVRNGKPLASHSHSHFLHEERVSVARSE